MGLSRNIKIFITLGIVLFAGSSLLVGLLSGQSEGPDLVQPASAEIDEADLGITSISASPATSVATTSTTVMSTPTPTTTPTTVMPTPTKPVASTTPNAKNFLNTGGYTIVRADGLTEHYVKIINKEEDPFIGTVTLSCVLKGEKLIKEFEVEIPGYWYVIIDWPGTNDQAGMVGTKIEAYTRA